MLKQNSNIIKEIKGKKYRTETCGYNSNTLVRKTLAISYYM